MSIKILRFKLVYKGPLTIKQLINILVAYTT